MNHASIISTIFITLSLSACGGGGGGSSSPTPTTPPPVDPTTGIPANVISHAYFRDQDGTAGKIAGSVTIETVVREAEQNNTANSVSVYWADDSGNKLDGANSEPLLVTNSDTLYQITIPTNTSAPDNSSALVLYPSNSSGEATQGTLIKFHDFIGNVQLSGPGGNYMPSWSWYYGNSPDNADIQRRDKISVQRTSLQGGTCIFDNGLVSVTDMSYTIDQAWKNRADNSQPNEADDVQFPAYRFSCDANPINTHRYVDDEDGVWTYSTINDSMFYGTIVYDMFLKYLGEPALADKLRIRVHYGSRSTLAAYWDGAYATFSDAIPHQSSTASLDSIGHEIGHGVLNRLMGLSFLQADMSTDVKTLHEAFGDISGTVAWYELTGDSENFWLHGEENGGRMRQINQIQTTTESIESVLDYRPEDPNFYHRIGMITYPFFLLSEQWEIDSAYRVLTNSAKNCWTATQDFTAIAMCIKQQASNFAAQSNISHQGTVISSAQAQADVTAAFKTVKIKLFDEGVLSHFYVEDAAPTENQLLVKFTDDSRSTSMVSEWLWDFGDGQTSIEASPSHIYAAAGSYEVKLSVRDQSNDTTNNQDQFSRTIVVDQ